MIPDQERMADPVDVASDGELRNTEESVRRQRMLAAPEQEPVLGENGQSYWKITNCVECGEEIEARRLNLGKIRCFECQDEKERRLKVFGVK